MELNKEDIQKFYMLKSRFDETSPNIGIVGDNKNFKRVLKNVIKSMKNYDSIYMNSNQTKCTIIKEGIEFTYIQVRDTIDLRGYTFRKFI